MDGFAIEMIHCFFLVLRDMFTPCFLVSRFLYPLFVQGMRFPCAQPILISPKEGATIARTNGGAVP